MIYLWSLVDWPSGTKWAESY